MLAIVLALVELEKAELIRCSRTASLQATATNAHRRLLVRINRMPQDAIHLKHRPYQATKRPVLHCSGQAHAEYFQQPTDLVSQIHCLLEQGLSRAQKRPKPAGFTALHMNRTDPPSSQNLGNALCICLVGFVSHRRLGSTYLARLHTYHFKAFCLQAKKRKRLL